MSSVGKKQYCRSEISTPVPSLSNVFKLQKRKSGRTFPNLLSIFQKLQLKKYSCSEDVNKSSVHNILCNNEKQLIESFTKTSMLDRRDKDLLSENSIVCKNIHLPKENMQSSLNSTYVFIDNEAVAPYEDIMVNSITDNGKQTGTNIEHLESKKTIKKPPPVPPLPLVLICKTNKDTVLQSVTSNNETLCSNSHLQHATTKHTASIEISSGDRQKNSSNIKSSNENVGKLSSETKRHAFRRTKRPAPKPPVVPSLNQPLQLNECCENKPSSEKRIEKQMFNQTEEYTKYECPAETNKENKVTIYTCLANEDSEKCPSINTSLDSPPELPAKTLPHDNKLLFGYSMEERASAREVNNTIEHGCNNFGTQDNNIHITRALWQLTSPLNCRTALAVNNNTVNKQITSRDAFYKSLSIRRNKKSNSKILRQNNCSTTHTDKESHHFPVLCSAVGNIADLPDHGESCHITTEKEGTMSLSIDSSNKMRYDVHCLQSSQDDNSFLSQQSSTVPVPFVSEKYNVENSLKIFDHLQSKNKCLEERTNRDSSFSEILSTNTSHIFPQITSNIKHDESLACTEDITSVEDKEVDEVDTKHSLIKAGDTVSRYDHGTDIASQEKTCTAPSTLERMDKNKCDIKISENDSMKQEIKCPQIDNKLNVLKEDLDNSFRKVKANKKEVAQIDSKRNVSEADLGKSSHYTTERGGTMSLSIEPSNKMRADVHCLQISRDEHSFLSQQSSTVPVQFVSEKCNVEKSFKIFNHLENKNKCLVERTNHNNSFSEILNTDISQVFPQTTSNTKSLDCTDITSVEDKEIDEIDSKHSLIKASDTVSRYDHGTDIVSREKTCTVPSTLERMDKNNCDIKSTANYKIKQERKCSQISNKQNISEDLDSKSFTKLIDIRKKEVAQIESKENASVADVDESFAKVVEGNKKEAECCLIEKSGNASQFSAYCNNLKCANTLQVNCEKANTEQKDILKSNTAIMEACQELQNTAFFESHSDAKIVPTLLETDGRKISKFQRTNSDRLSSRQNTSKVANSFKAIGTDMMMKGPYFEKEKLPTATKLFQSELHLFASKNDSSHISDRLGVMSQNRNNTICPVAKSTRPLQETSTLTSSQQTSTTSELSTPCKLGPSKIYNQATFLPAWIMSSQKHNITVLFRELEAAIANGHHKKAAILARELALHKVACKLSSFNIHEHSAEEKQIMINLYIEDKNLHQGPFPLLVHCTMTLGALKSKLEKEFELPKNLQRWILGKRLATDDNTTLQDYGVTETGCSVFLYLICDDSIENQNSLLEKISRIPKNVFPVQRLCNFGDISLHNGNKGIRSLGEVKSEETIIEENNISEDEDISASEDNYLIYSDFSPVSAIDGNAEVSEAEESENQLLSSASHSDSEAEAAEESMSHHSSSSDFVMITDDYLEENEILNYEQHEDELDMNLINKTSANNGEVIHLIEENIHSHLEVNKNSGGIKNDMNVQHTGANNVEVIDLVEEYVHNHIPLIESVSAISPINDRAINGGTETKSFSNACHIPNTNEKEEMGESLTDYTSCDENPIHDDSTDAESVSKESEVYFNAGNNYISPINKEQSPEHSLSPEVAVVSPLDGNQQCAKLAKLGEIKELFETAYIAVKKEFDSKEENYIKFAPSMNYIMPTAKQKVEDLYNSKHLQIENSHIQQSKASTFNLEEKLEQNAAERQELDIEQEEHGYLPEMEFVAVINEFYTETGEEEQKESHVEPYHFVNYAIPTTIELTEQKLENIQNAQAVEIWVPEMSAVLTTEEKLEKSNNSKVACVACGSLHDILGDKCESCKSETDMENEVDKANTSRFVDPPLIQASSDDDKELTDYQYLMQLDNQDLIPNAEPFWCPVCFTDIEERQGVVLRDCLHQFCKECLAGSVEHSESAIIKCPFRNEEYSCESHLQEREIKAVVTAEIFERYLRRGMMTAEGRADNSIHCKMPDCPGWCILDNPASSFQCPTCSHTNCLKCRTVHEGLTCQQYQEEQEYQLARNEEIQETKNYLDNMIKEGKAMPCPKCDAFVIKRWGCDWLKCSVCQTEICWVTKKARWGPGGHGDTSDGCKCGVNGQKCHPNCNYCH